MQLTQNDPIEKAEAYRKCQPSKLTENTSIGNHAKAHRNVSIEKAEAHQR
jgi:hypothetical protein